MIERLIFFYPRAPTKTKDQQEKKKKKKDESTRILQKHFNGTFLIQTQFQPAQVGSAGGRRGPMVVSVEIQKKPGSREKCKMTASPGNSLEDKEPL